MPIMGNAIFDAASLRIETPGGDRLALTSLRYNASISALEIRAVRFPNHPPCLVEKVGKGPIRLVAHHPLGPAPEVWLVHFEKATLGFPLECVLDFPSHEQRDGGGTAVYEVVVLRGLRVESEV